VYAPRDRANFPSRVGARAGIARGALSRPLVSRRARAVTLVATRERRRGTSRRRRRRASRRRRGRSKIRRVERAREGARTTRADARADDRARRA
jgi:hypothetical protein